MSDEWEFLEFAEQMEMANEIREEEEYKRRIRDLECELAMAEEAVRVRNERIAVLNSGLSDLMKLLNTRTIEEIRRHIRETWRLDEEIAFQGTALAGDDAKEE